MLSTASTSNPPLFLTPFGLPPCFPPLQRPIRHSCESLLDFLRASHRFNVQSAAPVIPFWTSSVPPSASTSNPPLLQIPFGLPPCLPPLQRPIPHSYESLLDFLRVSLCFNVQSAALSHPFWTSSVPPTASTSNLPLFLIPFGLPPCLPPLQRPIRRSCESLLDFLRAFHRFNVQSATSVNPFWTSSMSPSASTSNPPLLRIPFGLPPCLPPLQRPIRRSCDSLLDFLRASRRFNVQSATPVIPFWTSSVSPSASTSNPPLFLTPFGLPPCLPPLQRPIRTIHLASPPLHSSFLNIL